MNERRRIIIQTGADPDESLTTPHFDSEARMSARPVVPLSEQETFQMSYGASQSRGSKPFWKRRAMLALIVVLAIGAGVAGGFAISMYRNRQAAKAAEPNPATPAGESAIGSPTPERSAKQQAPVTPQAPDQTNPSEEETKRNTVNDEPSDDEEVSPPVAREKKPQRTDEQADRDLEAREEERERRREERRERRRRDREDKTQDIPSRIDRAGREIKSRIEEIFEGRQP